MDVLKIFFKSLLISFFLSVVTLFGLREYLIVKTTTQIGLAYRQLFHDYNTGAQEKACALELGRERDRSAENVYQLRFIDRHNYRLEVLCGGLVSNAILIKQEALPPLVYKNAIGSGFIVAKQQKEVVGFRAFYHSAVNWQDQLLKQAPFLSKDFYLVKNDYKLVEKNNYQNQMPINQTGPVTNCNGYGFSCCDPNLTLGQGQKMSQALDCPENCFATCQPRPVILAFNANGNYDIYSKTIKITNHDTVDFVATVSKNHTLVSYAEIDFGDGQKQKINHLNKIEAEHQYDCNQTQCGYIAKVKLVTNGGVSSLDSSIAQIKVIVRN